MWPAVRRGSGMNQGHCEGQAILISEKNVNFGYNSVLDRQINFSIILFSVLSYATILLTVKYQFTNSSSLCLVLRLLGQRSVFNIMIVTCNDKPHSI